MGHLVFSIECNSLVTGLSALDFEEEDEEKGSKFSLPDFGGKKASNSKFPSARRRILPPKPQAMDSPWNFSSAISYDPVGSLGALVPDPDMSLNMPSRLPG